MENVSLTTEQLREKVVAYQQLRERQSALNSRTSTIRSELKRLEPYVTGYLQHKKGRDLNVNEQYEYGFDNGHSVRWTKTVGKRSLTGKSMHAYITAFIEKNGPITASNMAQFLRFMDESRMTVPKTTLRYVKTNEKRGVKRTREFVTDDDPELNENEQVLDL